MRKAIITALIESLKENGRRASLCNVSSLLEVRQEIEKLRDSGQVSGIVYERYLSGFSYVPPSDLPKAKSVLVTALPVGRSVIELETVNGRFDAIIPPTYGAEEHSIETERQIGRILGAEGLGFARAWLPVKSLAAHTGLGRYGRDNILRFEGAGSYVRLDAWWTELDAKGEPWGPASLLDRCASCGACVQACPNACFAAGRVIVDASRCLTLLNEGDEPFPSWLERGVHKAAVGCLRCQEACPENRQTLGAIVDKRFILDRESSELLLSGTPVEQLSVVAADAVRAADMVRSEARLARNLRALADAMGLCLN